MLAAITHSAAGVPADCGLPVTAWSTAAGGVKGTWLAEADTAGIGKGRAYMSTTWVGGGLYGYAGVVNVNDATAFGQDGIAIVNAVDSVTANAAVVRAVGRFTTSPVILTLTSTIAT